MTKADILAALRDLADDAPIVLDLKIDTFLELEAQVDPGAGVRLVVEDDEEGKEFSDAIGAAFR